MQSTFRLAWPAEQKHFNTNTPSFPSDINTMHKRKRASSPAPSPLLDMTKKAKLGGNTPTLDVAHSAQDILDTASLAYATPGATPTTAIHRSEYPAGAFRSPSLIDISRNDSVYGESAPGSLVKSKPDVDNADQDMLDVGIVGKVAPDSTSPVQQAIENLLNLQILLKHNELRLIAQEEAKCQIALEQLRRCELRPYPGTLHPSQAVSDGTGPAVQSGPESAKFAAPYGVTDGPYSRHYSQWLLKDSAFEIERAAVTASVETPEQIANRSTRLVGTARKYATKSVAAPQQPLSLQQSLPNYPPPSVRKEKSGPLILRRSTDGRLVKLVCNDCNRGDMNSIQGFLNHCRIAHKVDYKSHDQAAVSCGRPMDDEEIASLPAETQATPVSKPTTRAARMATAPLQPLPHGAVHPYNTASPSVPRSRPQSTAQRGPLKPVASLVRPFAKQSQPSTSFKLAPQAPHLSALMAKHNPNVDLSCAIAAARKPTELCLPGGEEDFSSRASFSPTTPSFNHLSGPHRGGKSLPPQISRKAYTPPSQQQFATSPHQVSSPDEPGLISDLEDDDHGSASEEESSVPLPSRGGMLLPVAARERCVENVDGMEGIVRVQEGEEGVMLGRKMNMKLG